MDNPAVQAPSSAESALLNEEQGPPQLGAKRAFKIFVTFYLVQILVGVLAALPVGVAAGIQTTTSGETSGASYEPAESQAIVVGSLVGTLFAAFVSLRMARRTLPGSIASGALSSIGWSRASASQLRSAAALGATIALFSIVLVRLFPPAPDRALGPLSGAIRHGGWPLHIWALLVLVSAPIEEFVHRGVLFSGLSRSWGTLWSGVFTTVVFVLGHLFEVRTYWPALLPVTLVATVFIMLRIKMKSFIPAVICHAAYNAVIVVTTYGGDVTSR